MSVSGVTTNSTTTAGTPAVSKGTTVDKDEFLTLLVTQLKNQDPLDPTDQKEMLAQLAQFSSLEQMQSLNQTMTTSAQFGNLAQGAALIGKTVSAGAGDSAVSGLVSSVTVENGKTLLHIGDQDVDASSVTQIK